MPRKYSNECILYTPSESLTWNLNMAPCNRRFVLETIIVPFHVQLLECTVFKRTYIVFFCAPTVRVDVVLQQAVESGNKGVISFGLSLASLKSDHQRKMWIFS